MDEQKSNAEQNRAERRRIEKEKQRAKKKHQIPKQVKRDDILAQITSNQVAINNEQFYQEHLLEEICRKLGVSVAETAEEKKMIIAKRKEYGRIITGP